MDELNLLNSNLDLSVLDNLSPEQRELALSILQEYAQTGDSEAYSKLILEDYAETPVDILTFVDDYNYLGNAWHDAEGNSKLYPYWRKELVKIFPDNFTTTVNNGIFSGSRGRGKEQPLSSLVLSEHGYITMGDVEVGTKVYGRDGQLHPVTAIYPQGVKDIYKITFSDNTSARCGLQHLWQVEKDGKSFTINIKQLLECSKNESLTNYYIPLCQPVDFAFNKNIDEAYMEGCDFALGKEILRTETRYSNISARIALLQGILDTLGEVTENYIKVSVTPVQKEGILWLVHSLGGVALTKDATLKIFLPESVQPFRSSKKLSRYNNAPHIRPYRRITSIEKLPYKEECQCIMVDSAEHLYITDNFIVTHNTEVALLIASYLLHRILCLKDPIAYYHLKPTEKLVFAFMNIKLALAEEIGVSKFQNTLQSSPWFMAHGELEGRTKKIWVPQKYNNQVAIDIKIGSQADDLVGLPIFFCLSGDTPILTDRGTYDIESLENKIIRVPSVDDTGHIILSDECTVKQTAECDIEYSLELENGAIIKCTPTHRFKLTDGSYKEARYLTEEDELFDIAPYGYIYKTINLLNGKIYVGQHKGTIFDKGYLGSGQLLSKALQKYGREAFEIELLAWAPDKTTLDALEKYYIKYYDACDHERGYNIAEGGQGGDLGPRARQHISDALKGRPKSAEHKLKLSAANRGKQLSQDTKNKIAAKNKNRIVTSDTRKKMSEAAKKIDHSGRRSPAGKIIITDGQSIKYIEPRVDLPEGWRRGNCKTAGTHNMSNYYSCPENKIKKSSAHRGARNYMYNKGYLRIGGANTNAKKFYCIDDQRFECRKDLLNYLRINLYANITPNILRNIEKENYTQYIKKHFPYLIQNLTWGYKNEN